MDIILELKNLTLDSKEHNFQPEEQGKMEIDIRPLLEKI
jgi:hypothetical protein